MVERDQSEADGGTSDDDLAAALAEELDRAIHHSAALKVVDGMPQRPTRQSIPIDVLASELAHAAGDGNTEDIMHQLETQLQLRQHEATAFSEWASTMEELGTPDALAAVSEARTQFSDVLSDRAKPADSPLVSEESSSVAPRDIDHDLRMAPAPMSAPILDIPPPQPPPQPLDAGRSGDQEQLHPLVEPADAGTIDFDEVLGISRSLSEGARQADAVPVSSVPVSSVPVSSVPVSSVSVSSVPVTRVPSEFEADEPDESGTADSGLLYTVTSSGNTEQISAPIASVPSPVVSASIRVISETPPASARVFHSEEAGVEPTPIEQRVGRAARMFWLWFAANSSVVSVVFGGVVLSLGMSLRQAIVATLAGVAVSFLPLGLGTLAGKWSGQPTMIVSRASFGHLGNALPSAIAVLTRLFWGALLLWFLAAGTSRILVGAELNGPLSENQLTIVGLAAGFLIALVIAFFGYSLIARMQLVVSVISAILIVGLIIITWPTVNLSAALTIGDGPWILVVTGAVLVFSFVGLVWAVSSADLARYQRPSTSGGSAMLWSTFGATLPAFTLIAYGAVLAASDQSVAIGLVEHPLDTIALLIPIWYPVPLIAAVALSLLSGVVISIYSGAFALQAVGARLPRPAAVVIVGVALAAVAGVLALWVGDFTLLVRDVATSLAVPVSAWAGIFAAEMMIRHRRFHTESLLTRGGRYRDFRWVNLTALIVITAIGFGLTTASVSWLSWQGYLYALLGVSTTSDLAASDSGVFVALLLGILTPIVAGIPAIRRQEQVSAPGN